MAQLPYIVYWPWVCLLVINDVTAKFLLAHWKRVSVWSQMHHCIVPNPFGRFPLSKAQAYVIGKDNKFYGITGIHCSAMFPCIMSGTCLP